jgi:hypothetical protein
MVTPFLNSSLKLTKKHSFNYWNLFKLEQADVKARLVRITSCVGKELLAIVKMLNYVTCARIQIISSTDTW